MTNDKKGQQKNTPAALRFCVSVQQGLHKLATMTKLSLKMTKLPPNNDSFFPRLYGQRTSPYKAF